MKSNFEQSVGIKYTLYNSLLLQLPFDMIYQTGLHLPVLHSACEDGYKTGKTPSQIINQFFADHFPDKSYQETSAILFNVIQYVERQVVLFDSVEDSAFEKMNDLEGDGTLAALAKRVEYKKNAPLLQSKINDFKLHLVLTAHPTQFYPSTVLGIINQLDHSIRDNNLELISDLLIQLGKTPFLNRQKPTPFDEAKSSIWYLENVFYESAAKIVEHTRTILSDMGEQFTNNNLISLGFWPGGDRDGNPFVTSETTRKVAEELKSAVFRSYHKDLLLLKNKLTFKFTDELIQNIEQKVYAGIYSPSDSYKSAQEILDDLKNVSASLVRYHNSLFVADVEKLITKVHLYALHFAKLDIRQDSRIHDKLIEAIIKKYSVQTSYDQYLNLSEEDKIKLLFSLEVKLKPPDIEDELGKDTIESLLDMQWIQSINGKPACDRYIISNCKSALHIIQVLLLAKWTAWQSNSAETNSAELDIIPLFESVESLSEAHSIMTSLYNNPAYQKHLASRGNCQTIMLGFSDGTKDGGYLCANWAIYNAKETLTKVAREKKIKLVFFDGRGGPPARGGGNTNKFYSSLGNTIEDDAIQLTIQGQTISSNFGTPISAGFNIEQLLTAGIENDVFPGEIPTLNETQKEILKDLSNLSFTYYQELKNDPNFLNYLQKLGPLDYYGMTNIGSRPAKRKSNSLSFEDLRAIPFVGTWSQLKQNVPGYYGVGLALEQYEKAGKLPLVIALYKDSQFFRTLIDNSMQVLIKTNFAITKHFSSHQEFGALWKKIFEEYERTKRYFLKLSGKSELLQSTSTKESINLRENIVLPLLTIQQYALEILRSPEIQDGSEKQQLYQKMVMRTMFGIINAGRNSA